MREKLARVSARQWAGLALAVLAIVFVVINRATMRISFFGLGVSGPTWLVLLLVLATGWVIGLLTARRRYSRR